jgi:hypothetical protein
VIVAAGRGARDDAVADTANDLLIRCTAAARGGADFQAVWDSILRGHPLVVSAPIETFTDDERPQREVRLINGQRLIHDPATNHYSVSRAARRRPL